MSARIRVPVAGLFEGPRTLDADASHHLAVVLRRRAGDAFIAFDPRAGEEADGRISGVERGVVHVELGAPRRGSAFAPGPITWIQGLAKGDKMDAIVRDATELGATRFVPAETEFSVVRLDAERAEQRRARWARVAEQAGRQCGRADPPVVDPPRAWHGALSIGASAAARFCLYERATDPLGPLLLRAVEAGQALAFAAGPEGGLSGAEVAAARDSGYAVVSLGELVLRTETVATAVLGAACVLLAGAARR